VKLVAELAHSMD